MVCLVALGRGALRTVSIPLIVAATMSSVGRSTRMNIPVALRRAILLATPFFLLTAPASAHHVMGGKLPSTFLEGLLSGLGHPVIGPEHLAVLLAVGVVVGASGLSLALPAVFVAAAGRGVTLDPSRIGGAGGE